VAGNTAIGGTRATATPKSMLYDRPRLRVPQRPTASKPPGTGPPPLTTRHVQPTAARLRRHDVGEPQDYASSLLNVKQTPLAADTGGSTHSDPSVSPGRRVHLTTQARPNNDPLE